MDRKQLLTKILALLGTLLVWIPLLLPVFFTAVRLLQGGRFMLDYLMPAELFPAALLGGGLLIWAGLRVRSPWWTVIGGTVAAMFFLGLVAGTAAATGLASGEATPAGWQWVLTLVFMGGFLLSLLITAIGGLLHLCGLIRPPTQVTLHPET